jgi:hypothetical protein
MSDAARARLASVMEQALAVQEDIAAGGTGVGVGAEAGSGLPADSVVSKAMLLRLALPALFPACV